MALGAAFAAFAIWLLRGSDLGAPSRVAIRA